VSQSSPIVLASGRLNRSGDMFTVELHQPADCPPFVMLRLATSADNLQCQLESSGERSGLGCAHFAEAQARLAVRRVAGL
jgi:hypothetical protein